MLQPAMPTWGLLLLLLGSAATAQPQAMRKRSVTLSAAASGPLPEVRVAAGVKTLSHGAERPPISGKRS